MWILVIKTDKKSLPEKWNRLCFVLLLFTNIALHFQHQYFCFGSFNWFNGPWFWCCEVTNRLNDGDEFDKFDESSLSAHNLIFWNNLVKITNTKIYTKTKQKNRRRWKINVTLGLVRDPNALDRMQFFQFAVSVSSAECWLLRKTILNWTIQFDCTCKRRRHWNKPG